MQISPVPTKIDVVWATSAPSTYVRAVPDTTSDPAAASWTQGFPPQTFVDPGAGGDPPDGRDFNGALQMLSAWTQWQCAGAPVFYDAAFSASVGGYPKFAMVANATTPGQFWISTADNNTNAPGGSDWIAFPAAAAVVVDSFNTRTGAVVLSSADVVSALATGALPLAKLAIAPAGEILGNPSGSSAEPSWNLPSAFGIAAIAATLGSPGSLSIDIPGVGTFIAQWGRLIQTISAEGHVSVALPFDFPNALDWYIGTALNAANSALEDIWTQNTNASDTSTLVFYCQGTSSSPGSIQGIDWFAIGH